MFTIQELYAYSSKVRNRFAKKLAEMPWEEVEKNREASFYSLKNILLHMIDNEDWIVNWVIPGKSSSYVRRKSAEYTSMNMILDHLEQVQRQTAAWLHGLSDQELSRRTRFTLSSGETFDLSVEECIFQSFTEQLYHLGELIALLWQENIEPPPMQWFRTNPRTPSDHESAERRQIK